MSKREYDAYYAYEDTHWWFRGRRQILRVFLDRIDAKYTRTVLEIGCGTGGNLCHLFAFFAERIGVELDPYAAELCRRKLGDSARILEGDASDPPVPPESVDCIALLDVLYHRRVPAVAQVMRACRRRLKPGGYLLISDGAFEFLAGQHNRAVDSVRRFTRGGLERMLREEGFAVVKCSYWGMALFVLLFVKRFLLERLLPQRREGDGFDIVSIPVLDQVLYAAVVPETLWLRFAGLPFGASIAVLARKT